MLRPTYQSNTILKVMIKEERGESVRKAYAPKGERSQKMMSFRVDLENINWLEAQPNKGRYINDLIAADRKGTSRRGDK